MSVRAAAEAGAGIVEKNFAVSTTIQRQGIFAKIVAKCTMLFAVLLPRASPEKPIARVAITAIAQRGGKNDGHVLAILPANGPQPCSSF